MTAALLERLPAVGEIGRALEQLGYMLIVSMDLHVTGERAIPDHPRERLVVGFARSNRAAAWHGIALRRIPVDAEGNVVRDWRGLPLYDHRIVAESATPLATLTDLDAWLGGIRP